MMSPASFDAHTTALEAPSMFNPSHSKSSGPWHEELRRFARWLLERHASLGAITEIRVLRRTPSGEKGTWSGYFGPEDLERLIVQLSPRPGGPSQRLPHGAHPRSGEANFYFSLQGVDPKAAGPVRGTLERVATTTRDRDISVYSLFVVDIDPERPAGISSTMQEKRAAFEVMEAVRGWLQEKAIRSILADSGNGYHLLIPLIPFRGEAVLQAARDARELLRLLHARFSTPGAKVDTSTFNPSRVLKLYGTLAVKGESTEERPHRLACIALPAMPAEDVPDIDLFAVLRQELEDFRAAQTSLAPGPTRSPSRPTSVSRPMPTTEASGWSSWRKAALGALRLETVYGALLTGRTSRSGWLECRDPASPSGDNHPSAGVADGSGEAERGTFHSFRTGESCSLFDFLVQQGRASDFKTACALVAELSGVALPTVPTDPQRLLQQFTARWSELEDDALRLALLRTTLETVLQLTPITRDTVLQQLRTLSGLSGKTLRDITHEVQKKLKAAQRQSLAPPTATYERTLVEYIVNHHTIAQLFDCLVRAILPSNRLFKLERELLFVERGLGPIPVSERNLPGLLSALVEIRFLRQERDGTSFVRYGVLPAELARAFVNDPHVLSRLPELKLYCRAPLFDPHWRFIGTPGFYPSGVYYDGPTVEPRSPEVAVLQTENGDAVEPRPVHEPLSRYPYLEKVMSGFFWRQSADRVNFLGVLLTALTMPHWGRGHPFMAINGNKPGVGKSTLARVLGEIVEGRSPVNVSYSLDDGEFEKQLATRVEAGDRLIVIDNAKTRKLESQVLERCITDSRPAFRRLGSNTSITRAQNDLLFVLTMNMVQLGPDLRRRALPVNLFVEESLRTLSFPLEDVSGFVSAHRLELVGELAGMVQTWVELGRPIIANPARHSTSNVWAAAIDSILHINGFVGFLSNFEDSLHDFDPTWELVHDIAAIHRDRSAAYAAEWVTRLEESGHTERFRDRRGMERTPRARATVVGALFSEYLDATFTVDGASVRLMRHYPAGPDHKPAYQFITLMEATDNTTKF